FYDFSMPVLPSGGKGLAINLHGIWYNVSPTTPGCYKNQITLDYDAPITSPAPPLAMSMIGNIVLVRVRKVSDVVVYSSPTCTSHLVRLREYYFHYQSDPDTGQPQLQSVTMTGQQDKHEDRTPIPIAAYTYGAATGPGGNLTYSKTQTIPLPSDITNPF